MDLDNESTVHCFLTHVECSQRLSTVDEYFDVLSHVAVAGNEVDLFFFG